jgi:PEP-CTERM motif/Thioester domain
MKNALLALYVAALSAAFIAALSFRAHAADLTVNGYSLPDPDALDAGTVDGYSYYDGPVLLDTSQGGILAYCVDLNHELHGQDYNFADLTESGAGVVLTQAQSNRIGQIAIAGFAAEGLPTPDGQLAAAAQLAIWSIAYNTTPTFFNTVQDPNIVSDFNFLMGPDFTHNTGTYATAIIPVGGWPQSTGVSQEMVIGLNAGTVPEPSTWAMMVAGFALIGALGWRKRTARYAIQ